MSTPRSIMKLVSLVAPLIAASATTVIAAPAAAQPLFTWSGTVDREVLIVMRGRSVSTPNARGLDGAGHRVGERGVQDGSEAPPHPTMGRCAARTSAAPTS